MKEQIKRLKGEIAQLSTQATSLYTEMEADTTKRNSANTEKFDKMVEDGMAKRAELVKLENLEALNVMSQPGDAKVGAGGDPNLDPAGGDGAAAQPYRGGKSWGQRLIESDEFKSAKERWKSGKLETVKVGNAGPVLSKALSSTLASGGYLYRADRQPEVIDTARQRPFSILDLVSVRQTDVDSVEYVEMSSRTNNAAFVPELDGARTHVSSGTAEAQAADNGNYQENFSMKPKGDLAFALKTAAVKPVAEWVPASRQILMDAPNLRGLVDDELTYMLRVKLEDYIIAANETGFVGILNASGIGSRVHKVSGARFDADDTVADTLRRMQTDIQLSFYEMDSYVLSPGTAEALELEKGADQHYVLIYDPVVQRVWRKAVVVSRALSGGNSGTAIAGNFQLGAVLWDRQDVEVRTGEPGNFFLENAIAILAELRAAFAVVRPLAFEKATGLPG